MTVKTIKIPIDICPLHTCLIAVRFPSNDTKENLYIDIDIDIHTDK